MSPVKMINGLINDISDGAIKGRLITLRQKIEAQETRLKDLKAKIVKLESQAKKEKLAPKRNKLPIKPN
jgi:cell division protein FtsL